MGEDVNRTSGDREAISFSSTPARFWGPLLLSVPPVYVAGGLFLDGLQPAWANNLMIALFLALVPAIFLICPRYERRMVTVDSAGLAMPRVLTRTISWSSIRHIRALRRDAVGRLPAIWEVYVWLDDAPSYLRKRDEGHAEDVVRLPLKGLSRPDRKLPVGDDLVRAIERFRPVERMTPQELVNVRERRRRDNQTAQPAERTVFRTSRVELLFAWIAAGLVSIIIYAIGFEIDWRPFFDDPRVEKITGGVLALALLFATIKLGMWRRGVELSVGPEGLYIRERVSRPLPWHEIEEIELYYDPTPTSELGPALGWVLRVKPSHPEKSLNRRQRRNLNKDGSFGITVRSISADTTSISIEQALADAIDPYKPVTVRQS